MKKKLLFLLISLPILCLAQTKSKPSPDEQEYRDFMKQGSGDGQKLNAFYQGTPVAKRQTKAFKDEYQSRMEVANEKYERLMSTWIKAHPNDMSSVKALNARAGQSAGELNDRLWLLYDLLSDEMKASDEGKALALKLARYRTPAIGSIAPGIEQPDPNDKMISLASYKGRYVLVDLWASWCVACRQGHPDLLLTYQKFKNKNFDILGVSFDYPTGKAAWLAAIKKDQLPWAQVSALQGWKNDAAKAYNINAIPQNFLIDPNGKIIAKGLHGLALDKKLAQVLAN